MGYQATGVTFRKITLGFAADSTENKSERKFAQTGTVLELQNTVNPWRCIEGEAAKGIIVGWV